MRRSPFARLSDPCRLRSIVVLLALALVLVPAVAAAQEPSSAGDGQHVTIIRDAETETLLRTFANPLFRAAGVDPNLVRITLIRDDALNSFVSTGNRLFIDDGLLAPGDVGQANLALAEEAMLTDKIATARRLAADITNAVKKENREGF
jgi:predicted Zn-dependent protease